MVADRVLLDCGALLFLGLLEMEKILVQLSSSNFVLEPIILDRGAHVPGTLPSQ